MKKNGFTLAEVLITLAIIGVVATLTLPALMTNTAEQQYRTGFKKGINTLTEAAQINMAVDGVGYADFLVTNTTDTNGQSLYGLLSKRASADLKNSKTGLISGKQGSGNYALLFRDGSALIFNPANTAANSTATGGKVSTMQDDGLPYGIAAVYDTNGVKGPNALSNCNGETVDVVKDVAGALTSTCTNAKRVIKDQFGVRLRGNIAVPNGPAARWVTEN